MMLEDRKNLGPAALEAAAQELAAAANADPRLSGVFTPFTSTTPNLYADIDRARAAKLGVPAQRVFEALQVYLGSTYINDLNYLGRTYQVMAQADEAYRLTADDIGRYKTRNDAGEMVPIGSVATFHNTTGPYRVPRYNQFPAAEVQGNAAPVYRAARHWRRWSNWPRCTCPMASGTSGRICPMSRSRRATWRSRCSGLRYCLCSWCWRHNMKAGRNRCRSS
jgi:multidrug efflux pump subunit AcrB